jgi:hypothetical protein
MATRAWAQLKSVSGHLPGSLTNRQFLSWEITPNICDFPPGTVRDPHRPLERLLDLNQGNATSKPA